ncbi:MAG: C39 family peptidase [Bacillota bacterium]|nr:C39 family peptidase [Bacillota bacterium]
MNQWISSNLPFSFDEGTQAQWRSEIISAPQFRRLLASWNCSTSPGSFIEVSVRARIGEEWTKWFSQGKWSGEGRNTGSFGDQKNSLAWMDIDVLRVYQPADAFQVSALLTRKDESVPPPVLHGVHVSTTNDQFKYYDPEAEGAPNIHIDVPAEEQISFPEIGNIICSPTSTTMVLQFHGLPVDRAEVVHGCVDNGINIYGNWTYNAAYAFSAGEKHGIPLRADARYVESFEDVLHYLKQGLPVVGSIFTRAKEELEGTFSAHPAGHLLVITGIEKINGSYIVHVNDPATSDREKVKRKYKYDQFCKAWRHVIYVIEKR